MKTTNELKCPLCEKNDRVKSLLFMGVQPDGYVCERCSLYFDMFEDGAQALATVISAEGDDG